MRCRDLSCDPLLGHGGIAMKKAPIRRAGDCLRLPHGEQSTPAIAIWRKLGSAKRPQRERTPSHCPTPSGHAHHRRSVAGREHPIGPGCPEDLQRHRGPAAEPRREQHQYDHLLRLCRLEQLPQHGKTPFFHTRAGWDLIRSVSFR